jgi:ankyrin repeat protein
VSLLLERGASTSARDGGKKTPLHVAAEVGVTETVRILISKGADVSSVDEQKVVFEYLIQRGENASIQDVLGKTAWDEARRFLNDRQPGDAVATNDSARY